MKNQQLVSFCIPTNGVSEWVFPVLDSIVSQDVDQSLYEIVVTDNGSNAAFKEKMRRYAAEYPGVIRYQETDSPGFLNQADCFALAAGPFVKFVNHRWCLLDGAVQHFVDFARSYLEERPEVYFLNGAAGRPGVITEYRTFDSFLRGLSYYSSWSAGVAFWKDEVAEVLRRRDFHPTFPHSSILFHRTGCTRYLIDNTKYMRELTGDATKKGRYRFFQAFAVEYVACLAALRAQGQISERTFRAIVRENGRYVARQYARFVLLKEDCAFDLTGARSAIEQNYNWNAFFLRSCWEAVLLRLKGWLRPGYRALLRVLRRSGNV